MIKKSPIEADEKGLSFFIQREGENLPRNQVLRELVQNGFEAKATCVTIDFVREEGLKLLRVSDNGHGMDENALRTHIKTIHLSGKELGHNHGIGARVAGLAQNPAGVTWASRQDEGEAMVKVIKENEIFVLEKWEVEDGHLVDVVAPEPDYLHYVPEGGSGTAVVLHGDGITDTWMTTADVLTYLNGRYWDLPGHVMVREYGNNKAQWRHASGLDDFLSKYQEERGYFDMHLVHTGEHFRLHWALLNEAGATQNPRFGARYGQIGAMLEGELFRWSTSTQRMVQFGITNRKVQQRVVIVVELTHRDRDPDTGWVMNTGRDDIRRAEGRNEIEWAVIGRGFAQNMPPVLRKLVEDSEQGRSHEHLLRYRFGKRWQQLTRHMPKKQGDSSFEKGKDDGTDGIEKGKGDNPRPRLRQPAANHGRTRQTTTGRIEQRRRAKPKSNRKNQITDGGGLSVNGVELPRPIWYHEAEFPGTPGRFMVYADGDDKFHLNQDHPLVQNALEYYGLEYPNLSPPTIEMRVKEEFGVEMLGKLVHVNELRDSKLWSKEDIEKMLSQESLTFAALGMQALDSRIVQTLKAIRG